LANYAPVGFESGSAAAKSASSSKALKRVITRNVYGFTAAQMKKIARNLHDRVKERIAIGRSKSFR